MKSSSKPLVRPRRLKKMKLRSEEETIEPVKASLGTISEYHHHNDHDHDQRKACDRRGYLLSDKVLQYTKNPSEPMVIEQFLINLKEEEQKQDQNQKKEINVDDDDHHKDTLICDKTCTPSYRVLWRKEPLEIEEGEKSLINHQYRSVARPYTPRLRRKSSAEDLLFDMEESRYEADMLRHRIESATKTVLELLSSGLAANGDDDIGNNNNNNQAPPSPERAKLEEHRRARDVKFVQNHFCEPGLDVVEAMRLNPRWVLELMIQELAKIKNQSQLFLEENLKFNKTE